MGARTRDCCREIFLLLTSQYVFSLALFVVNNKSLFMENSQLYNLKTRNNLYFPTTITFNDSSLFWHQQASLSKNLSSNFKQFKTVLNNFLPLH